ANGVTTVRGMLGHPNQLNLRARANSGELVSPTLYLAGPGFRGDVVESPEHAAQMVRQQADEGWDLLKVYPGLTVEEYDAMADTAREVGIPFAGHVPADVGIVHALEKGQRTIDHLDGYIEYLDGDEGQLDEARLQEIVKLTLDSGAGVIPTMALWETIIGAADFETLRNYPELKYMPRDVVEGWGESYQKRITSPNFDRERASRIAENRKVLLRALAEGGVTILFGTDAPQQFSVPGFSIFREAEHMAECGLSPAQILVSGTINVGEYFQDKDTFGQVAEGHRADLILLTANPLEDISNLSEQAGVMVRGRWLSREEIDQRLSDLAAKHGSE
ncbi:MAG TPA: amidohydrolase family protein, partial [Acidobacteriota bacterium]|nr:amidohydrolase family protein [Acidobacteriota bacterium]